jgi:hypothetical protein
LWAADLRSLESKNQKAEPQKNAQNEMLETGLQNV